MSVTKMSSYRNVLWPKCPVTEMSVTKTSITKVSFTEMSGYRLSHPDMGVKYIEMYLNTNIL